MIGILTTDEPCCVRDEHGLIQIHGGKIA